MFLNNNGLIILQFLMGKHELLLPTEEVREQVVTDVWLMTRK